MNAPVTSCVCAITGIITFLGFRNDHFKNSLIFEPRRILARKQWYRLLSSALLHADWAHLLFNLVTIYSFGCSIELGFGPLVFLSIYILSVLGGSLLSLYVHRNHQYTALGASGGACGLIFAAIFLEPGTGVGAYLLPVNIPGPIYAPLYLIGTYVALRRNKDNIGHDAHFGGSVVGLLLALILAPQSCAASPILFAICSLLSAAGIYAVFRDPLALIDHVKLFTKSEYKPSLRYQTYDESKKRKLADEEVDRILEKISQHGLDSLSQKERTKLNAASTNIRRG